jgi:hypothetical protein
MKSNVKNIELVKYEDLFKNEETRCRIAPLLFGSTQTKKRIFW